MRYRAREYDAPFRYHRDLNFTMMRNWVGQIGDDEFYEACDRYGIVDLAGFLAGQSRGRPGPQR